MRLATVLFLLAVPCSLRQQPALAAPASNSVVSASKAKSTATQPKIATAQSKIHSSQIKGPTSQLKTTTTSRASRKSSSIHSHLNTSVGLSVKSKSAKPSRTTSQALVSSKPLASQSKLSVVSQSSSKRPAGSSSLGVQSSKSSTSVVSLGSSSLLVSSPSSLSQSNDGRHTSVSTLIPQSSVSRSHASVTSSFSDGWYDSGASISLTTTVPIPQPTLGGGLAPRDAFKVRGSHYNLTIAKREGPEDAKFTAGGNLYHGGCTKDLETMRNIDALQVGISSKPDEFTYKGGFYLTPYKENAENFVKGFRSGPCKGDFTLYIYNFKSVDHLMVESLGKDDAPRDMDASNEFWNYQNGLGNKIDDWLGNFVTEKPDSKDAPPELKNLYDPTLIGKRNHLSMLSTENIEKYFTTENLVNLGILDPNSEEDKALLDSKSKLDKSDVIYGWKLLLPSQKRMKMVNPFKQVVIVSEKGKDALTFVDYKKID